MMPFASLLRPFGPALVAALCVLVASAPVPAGAAESTADAAAAETAPTDLTTREREGLGCIVVSGTAGAATVLFSGAALAISAPGVAATAIAVPVLVATMAAGCSIGAVAAPGVAWIARQKGRVAEMVDGFVHQLERLTEKWGEAELPPAPAAPGAPR